MRWEPSEVGEAVCSGLAIVYQDIGHDDGIGEPMVRVQHRPTWVCQRVHGAKPLSRAEGQMRGRRLVKTNKRVGPLQQAIPRTKRRSEVVVEDGAEEEAVGGLLEGSCTHGRGHLPVPPLLSYGRHV